MNQYRKFGFLIAILIALTACSKEPNQNKPVTTTTETGKSNAPPATEVKQRGNALVRVIDAVPGGPALDVFADDSKIFTGLVYKNVSPYREVSGELHDFRIRQTGQDKSDPLADNRESLDDGKHYTVVAWTGLDNRPALFIENDDIVPPSPEKVKIRVIDTAADADQLDVYLREGDKKITRDVSPITQTFYGQFDPMSGTVEVRPSGKTIPVVTISNAKFVAGRIYTILILGKAKGDPKLEAMIVEDKLMGSPTAPAKANPNQNANL